MNATEAPLVNLAEDSHVPPPAEMAALLSGLSREVEADYYGNGGAVEAFEKQAAAYLGKEAAVMFPTGTLANLMAMRHLCGGMGARVIVHRDSHLFNDSGDNLAHLGGLTMVPLAGEGANFTGDQVRAELARTATARVASKVGAVAVETPSRRHHGRRFTRIAEVATAAREAGVPLFLDGARMAIECGWTGQDPVAMAAPFDVVYLSLYKYLKAPFGCVIAGSAEMMEGLYHDRRRFGGSLYQMWPAAVLAADALPNQAAIWQEARAAGDAVRGLIEDAGLDVTRWDDGTNIFQIACGGSPEGVKSSAHAHGIVLPPPSGGVLSVKVNETWSRLPPDDLAERIVSAVETAEGV